MSNAFTVTPMSKEVSLTPGQVYEGSIMVSNPADATEDFHYLVSVSPYSVLDEDYTADFTTVSDWSQIVDWITIENPTGVIAPNGKVTVNYTISVPVDAPAGGQYAMLGVRSNNAGEAAEGVTIQNVFEMASLIYARVAGETRHEGEILSNNISGFVTNGLPMASALLTNNGNVHETASVTITIKNAFTGQVVFPKDDDENTFSEVVMPSSTRSVVRRLDSMPTLGIYEVTQDISYLGHSDSEYAHNTTTVVACPLWFLVLVVVTIGAIIGGIVGGIYKYRKNRRVF